MSEDDPRCIEVPIAPDALEHEIHEAIKQALQAKWTDLKASTDDVTITIKFQLA
jgi:hypothetical protein